MDRALQNCIKSHPIKTRRSLHHRLRLLCGTVLSASVCLFGLSASAAPQANFLMDARNGAVYAQSNADTPLHPASLTKMMTLYLAFEAVERGEISMDTPIRISARAAGEIPTKLGLKEGQTIALRYLVRAAAVKSANDAATAIAEGISGSQEAFADRMNKTARAMGMRNTHFVNAHGLTEPDHLSTARDMTMLGRHLIYDYPEYYNLFSRLEADAGIATVAHTNRKFLSGYIGADGIKTGYTSAAGYNLVASAEHNGERVIATVFGASSSTERAKIASDLMDKGFSIAPSRVQFVPPGVPEYSGAVAWSIRPVMRPEWIEERGAAFEMAAGFSYQDLISRRQKVLQTFDPIKVVPQATSQSPQEQQKPASGSFRSAAIPEPGAGKYLPMTGPSPDLVEIIAAATATVSELRGLTGMEDMSVRVSDLDVGRADSRNVAKAGIERAAMSDFDRGVSQGAEIVMSPPYAALQPVDTSPASIIQPADTSSGPKLATAGFNAAPLPVITGLAASRKSIPSIFNISDLEDVKPRPKMADIFNTIPANSANEITASKPSGSPPVQPRVQDVPPGPEAVADIALPNTVDEAIVFIDLITGRKEEVSPIAVGDLTGTSPLDLDLESSTENQRDDDAAMAQEPAVDTDKAKAPEKTPRPTAITLPW